MISPISTSIMTGCFYSWSASLSAVNCCHSSGSAAVCWTLKQIICVASTCRRHKVESLSIASKKPTLLIRHFSLFWSLMVTRVTVSHCPVSPRASAIPFLMKVLCYHKSNKQFKNT
ncbi:hypothetical protein T08_6594 [Trichinella sp. T8]|nr:hypothetical protein T08_6594 [Trichinella sp. T8]